ncbi:clathrin light chain-domain-containing protein [Gymnopilus junonius]|uniref:Clathrin light chain n=1 Tax=Gymnopilus junonius TaxID=109634 RepID=A0A9P5NWF8_GYMJU|nr:clathrin light chain-domain-containing protein [Gymnopilus junonius]
MSDLLDTDFSSSFQNNSNDEIDFDRAASAFPDISLDGSTELPTAPSLAAGGTNSGFSFDDFDDPLEKKDTTVKVTGDDEIEKFESEFPDIEVPQQYQPPQQPSYAPTTFAPQPQTSAFSSTPILTQEIEDEPQVIRDWREKQQEEIKARDEASKARRQETIDKAERAIEEFYETYAKKKERSIRDNKNSEAEFVADLQASLSAGTTWDRISNLIELQNSQSKTIARTGAGTTDLSRFKEVLLRLKREGDAAPGAAGY